MPSHSDVFPWLPHYGHFDFFEDKMTSHSSVIELINTSVGLYKIVRKADPRVLTAFICECYSFGCAEAMETISNIDNIDVIIINSLWCSYSPDAKRYCRSKKIGLFNIGDFMRALHIKDFWSYLNEKEKKDFRENRWE